MRSSLRVLVLVLLVMVLAPIRADGWGGGGWSSGPGGLPAASTSGGLLQVASGAWTLVSPGTSTSSAAGGWTTAIDLDFTAQASQSFATDGTYTIDGATWTKANSANEVTHAAITNGTGLVFVPSSATDYNGSTITLPSLRVTLQTLIPAFTATMPLRVWAYVSSDNVTATWDGAPVVVDNGLTFASSTTTAYLDYVRLFDLVAGNSPGYQVAGGSKTYANPAASSNRVGVIEFPAGVASLGAVFYSGAWSSGWPASSALVSLGVTSANSTTFGALGHTDATAWGVRLGAARSGSSTALSVTWARLRVDYRPMGGT